MSAAAIFATAACVLGALLFCALVGGYEIREDLRDQLDRAHDLRRQAEQAHAIEARDHERTRQAWADERAGATPMRPLWTSPTVLRITDALATNEAQRFDPETADWSEPSEWSER